MTRPTDRKRHSSPPKENSHAPVKEEAQFAFAGLERVIHERARLSILSSLAAHPQGLLFNDLKMLCDLTDGNLSRQLQALQTAQLVEVWKGTTDRRPRTLCRLTTLGQARFLEYISELERVVQNALSSGLTPQRASANGRNRAVSGDEFPQTA